MLDGMEEAFQRVAMDLHEETNRNRLLDMATVLFLILGSLRWRLNDFPDTAEVEQAERSLDTAQSALNWVRENGHSASVEAVRQHVDSARLAMSPVLAMLTKSL